MINIGVIGCGHWGSNHARVFYFSKNVRLMACCDSAPSRLNVIRETYRGVITTTDSKAVINHPQIDAVVIATPTASHFHLVRSALLQGKHVLCEKPMAIKEHQTAALVSLARKKNLILMVGYVFLFNDGILALKEQIAAKQLGKILYLHFTRTNLGPIRDDVDVIYDLASHDIAIASFLLESWPTGVSANAGFFLRRRICDISFLTLYYPKNIIVNIHVSWLDPRKIRRITCVGDKKMALWDDLDMAGPLRIFDKGVIKERFYSDYGEFQLLPREGSVMIPFVKLNEPLKKQNAHFLECLKSRRRVITDGVFAHNITKVLEAIQLSIKRKGKIQQMQWK